MPMDDFLTVADADGPTLERILQLAAALKRERDAQVDAGASPVRDFLHGRTVALLFEKPSLRTRASFEVAVHELGGNSLPMWDFEIGLGKRETVADTGRVLARYAHAIVLRTFAQSNLEELAEAADVPVVNALSDHEHPCQALADLLTLKEHVGDLKGRTLTYLGDGNNVAHSLLLAGAIAGLNVRVGHPEGYAPDAGVVARARELAVDTGAEVVVTTDAEQAAKGADALYTDVWASMGQEAEAEQRKALFADFQVTPDLMGVAADQAIFLHCLPAHRGEEVHEAVIDGPASRVFDQAENRLHAQKALLAVLLGVD
jgi:ornithine carbamoyltransferase